MGYFYVVVGAKSEEKFNEAIKKEEVMEFAKNLEVGDKLYGGKGSYRIIKKKASSYV